MTLYGLYAKDVAGRIKAPALIMTFTKRSGAVWGKRVLEQDKGVKAEVRKYKLPPYDRLVALSKFADGLVKRYPGDVHKQAQEFSKEDFRLRR